MGRKLFVIVLFMLPLLTFAQYPLEEIRQDLVYDSFDKERTVAFHERINKIEDPAPVIRAYQGIAEALMARVKWDPISKLSLLASSRDILDAALEKDKENLEIRFLRFSLEANVPVLFRKSDTMEKDKEVILRKLRELESHYFQDDMVIYMVNFMSESDLVSGEEIASIKSRTPVTRN